VNQLYWNHREAFDSLIASGERFHKAQTSGKVADMRTALDARREALTELSDLATSLLQDANNNATPDTIRRITSTLEAISAMSERTSRTDAPRPGRLTQDVDPPGFELFGSAISGAGMTAATAKPARVTPSAKSSSAAANPQRKMKPDAVLGQLEETRKAKTAAAKVSLQNAKRALTQARARAQSLEAAQKKVEAEAKKAEKLRREAEQRLEKAKAASEDAARRAQRIAGELADAAKAMNDAERTFEKASKELEKLLGEYSGR
jgi:methyl-accepting chemotaxis protein